MGTVGFRERPHHRRALAVVRYRAGVEGSVTPIAEWARPARHTRQGAPSDSKDRDARSKRRRDRSEVVLIRSEYSRMTPVRDGDDVDVDDVDRPCAAGERADVVCFVLAERGDVAAPEEAPELRLPS